MAQVLLTVSRGKPRMQDITVTAGTPIAGSDAMSLNIDQTKMGKLEAIQLLNELQQKIINSKWPMA